MATFKPAYLIHGDDHGRIAERRARLRALAEAESGAGGIELFEGEASTPEAVAAALSALTMTVGRRFVIADAAERWKDRDLPPLLAVLADLPPDTTVAFFAREEGRATAPQPLHDAVRKAGGDVAAERTVKSWELAKWAGERAHALGVELDSGGAQALVRQVGERQQRLLRELEKLALELGEGARIGVEEVEELTASSSERKAWTLADALVARDPATATTRYLELRQQGEQLPSLLYWMVRRVREAHGVARRLEAGESPAEVRRSLRMPPKAAEAVIADVQRTDAERLRGALGALADLELASRGGGEAPLADGDTAAIAAIGRIAAAA